MYKEGDEGDKNHDQGCHEKQFAITDKINVDFWFYKLHAGNLFADWFVEQEISSGNCADKLISAQPDCLHQMLRRFTLRFIKK